MTVKLLEAMMIKGFAAVLLLSVPASVLAQSAATQSAAVSSDKPELDRIVCERQQDIGSRIAVRKVCKTVREWQEERRVHREEVERVQQNTNMGPSG